jgi:hypothetical protein
LTETEKRSKIHSHKDKGVLEEIPGRLFLCAIKPGSVVNPGSGLNAGMSRHLRADGHRAVLLRDARLCFGRRREYGLEQETDSG